MIGPVGQFQSVTKGVQTVQGGSQDAHTRNNAILAFDTTKGWWRILCILWQKHILFWQHTRNGGKRHFNSWADTYHTIWAQKFVFLQLIVLCSVSITSFKHSLMGDYNKSEVFQAQCELWNIFVSNINSNLQTWLKWITMSTWWLLLICDPEKTKTYILSARLILR